MADKIIISYLRLLVAVITVFPVNLVFYFLIYLCNLDYYQLCAVVLDSIKLLAVDSDSNNATIIPVHFAFSKQTMKYVNQLIIKEDGNMFKLVNGDSLELWFDSSKIPYTGYQLFLLVAANII